MTFVGIDHEIFSTSILQRNLSVTGESYVYTVVVNSLGGLSLSGNNVNRLNDRFSFNQHGFCQDFQQ